MCGAVACWSSLLSHLSQPCVSRHVSCHWDVSQAPSVSAPTVRLSWAVVGNNVRSRDRMITCPPSVVWDRHRDKVKSNFIFLLLSDWQGLWDWKFVWSWEYLISTPRWNLRVVTASWITAEFVKIWTKSNKGCGSVCRSHLHPFNFKKQEEIFLSKINQSVKAGQDRMFTREAWKSTACPLPDWMKLKYFLYWLTGWSLHTFNRQLQQLLDNNNSSSSSSTSYLDQIMSIMADNILSFNLICKIDLNPEILGCVDSPLIIHLLPSNKNFFGWIR